MTCFVDANVLIAYAHQQDENHARSVALLQDVLERGAFGHTYISDYVIDEVVTHVYARTKSKQKAVQIGDFLLSSEFSVIFTGLDSFGRAWNLFQNSTGLSFTDCTVAELVKRNGIETLVSFDSGFDQLGIRRIG